MIYALDGHSAYQLRTYLPIEWARRITPVFYDSTGRSLASDQARLDNVLGHAPAWIIISQQLLQGYLDSTFGLSSQTQFNVSRVAIFDKPGSRARLALYEITGRK
jgi:hypothetical protein